MLIYRKRPQSVLIVFALVFAGCNSSTNGAFVSPSPSPTPQVSNLSGDYAGTLQDSQNGSATVSGTFAQNASSVGGALTVTGTSMTVTAAYSLIVAADNTLHGGIVIDYPSGTTCTFSTSGTYDTATSVITGSYTAVTNCSGQTGTYSLTQQCSDTVTNVARRSMTTPRC